MSITDNVVLIAFVGTLLILIIGALILTVIVRRLHAQELVVKD
ncbi:MAG: hypothetical protein RTV72_10130 [Candidatus Thorarchaeota archaeon]